MARPYEAVYIFDSALEEAAITEKLTRFHALTPQPGDEPVKYNHWGKRTLAYPIKKRETGYYVIANFKAEPSQLPEFERALKLDDGVLRFLVVADEHDYAPVRAAADRKFEEDDE
ncbi:MAG: 30S ribosomal protein S6 [Gemmatimonadales bacterium]|nr:30S ribosomal protein S6 [Gemmatimonadales bacterium]